MTTGATHALSSGLRAGSGFAKMAARGAPAAAAGFGFAGLSTGEWCAGPTDLLMYRLLSPCWFESVAAALLVLALLGCVLLQLPRLMRVRQLRASLTGLKGMTVVEGTYIGL